MDEYLVDDAVLFRFVGAHKVVALDVLFYFLQRLPGRFREDFVEAFARCDDMTRSYLNIGRLARGAAPRLMDHYFSIRQREAFAFGTCCENNRRSRSRDADTHGGDIGFDVIHRVEHGEPRRDGAARRVDIDLDVFLRVLRLEKEQLRDDEICGVVVNGAAEEDNAFLEEPRVYVVRALAKGRSP